jgi:hypothetical protein
VPRNTDKIAAATAPYRTGRVAAHGRTDEIPAPARAPRARRRRQPRTGRGRDSLYSSRPPAARRVDNSRVAATGHGNKVCPLRSWVTGRRCPAPRARRAEPSTALPARERPAPGLPRAEPKAHSWLQRSAVALAPSAGWGACHRVPPRATACRRVPPRAAACHRVPPRAAACRRVPPRATPRPGATCLIAAWGDCGARLGRSRTTPKVRPPASPEH